jgi:predicted AlkP superfamily pyrophosphatase or phosphodiesterase
MRLRSLARLLAILPLTRGLALAAKTSAGQGTGFNPALPLTHVDNGANSAWAQRQHYVVLVSLDGFRWDYAKRDNATHLLALGKHGVSAPDGMIPSYPSLTFPNHFTIVTGLYPGHHGIVANNFLDPAKDAR